MVGIAGLACVEAGWIAYLVDWFNMIGKELIQELIIAPEDTAGL